MEQIYKRNIPSGQADKLSPNELILMDQSNAISGVGGYAGRAQANFRH